MKNLVLILLCCVFAFSFAQAQYSEVNYSPDIYNEMKAQFYSPTVQKSITTRHKNKEQQRVIESEYLKFMALSSESKHQKIGAMGQCLVDQKMLKRSELKLITKLFAAFKSGNEKAAKEASKKIRNTPAKSPVMKTVVSTLHADDEEEGEENKDTKEEEGEDDGVIDDAADAIETASTVAGTVAGGAVAGSSGAKAGAALGKASGKVSGGMLKTIFNWLFGKGKGVVAGPNGEDCQPPFLILGSNRTK